MARVTHVKRAQQRYETVPVKDEHGEPKRVPVMDKRTGKQKVSKRGPVFRTLTVADKSKPLPLYTCDHCGDPIELGTPYKHITPKSGPYGGHQRNRHASCPTWNVWDYSYSLDAQLARISFEYGQAVASAETPDDVTAALEEAASGVRELAEQKEESASNIEDGFGHETYVSEELRETAENLNGWADDIENAEVPELTCEECDGSGKVQCETCNGEGQQQVEAGDPLTDCEDCDGEGETDCDQCDGSGEDVDTWRENVEAEVTIVDEQPF